MPLISSPTLSPKKLAANRANAQLSRGPMTLEGLIRMRDSKIKHGGAYARNREEALRALGEDPKDFETLDSSFHQIGRFTDLLLKVKREVRQVENSPMNIKNEGTSHDVDNKGLDFISHDITDNKAT